MGKNTCAIFMLVALSVVSGFPANKNDEVEFVPLEHQRPGSVPGFYADGDYSDESGFFPGSFNVGDFYEGLEAVMTRMREHLSNIFKNLPSRPEVGTDAGAGFPGFNLPNFGDLDLGKGNTTSVTKVIDGHKVVINETEYKNDGANGGSFVKIRVIDVKPNDSDDTTESASGNSGSTPASRREVEPLEDSIENEIPKTKEGSIYDNVESFDDVDFDAEGKKGELDWNEVGPLESFDYNGVENRDQQPFHDLSNDIYVNQLMANAGAPTNPDAEYIEGFDKESRFDNMNVQRRFR